MNIFKKYISSLGMMLALALVSADCCSQTLNNIEIRSKTPYTTEDFSSVLKPYLGREITVPLLKNVLNEISSFYRQHGYLAAKAYFPEQKSTDGVLSVVVETADLENIRINNLADLKPATVQKLFSRVLTHQRKPLNSSELNNELLLIRDLDSFDIAGYFNNSEYSSKAADLTLDLKPRRRFGFNLFYDNYGTVTTGKHRFVGVLNSSNLSGHADKANLLMSRSSEKQNNFSFDYRLPFNSKLTELTFAMSYGNYELGDKFSELDAKGNVFQTSLGIRQPLFRNSRTRVYLTSGGYYKTMTDKFQAYDVSLKRHSYGVTLGLGMDNFLPKTLLSHNISFNFGRLKNDNDYRIIDDKSFLIVNASSEFTHDFNERWNLSNRLYLQYANTLLDASDKFTPGGAYGVKGFDSNVCSSDLGIFDDVKLRYRVMSSPNLSLYSNFMQAYAKNRNSSAESLYAAGLGADLNYRGFYVNMSVNRALGHNRIHAEDKVKFLIKFGYELI